jgi:flagellar FliL protein
MAKEEQAVETKEAPPKDKKKMMIIVGAAVAVILIVVGVLMFSGGKKSEKAEKSGEATAEGHGEAKPEAKAEGHGGEAAKGGEGGHGGAGGAVSNIFPLEPFIVNIYDGQDLRYLKLKVELEMANGGVKSELDAKMASIRDAVLMLLTTKTLRDIQDLQGKNQLREEILNAVGKILTPGKVTKVLFTDFVVQ